ncbi:MAG: hypothetical protein GX085_00830 [Firmicutes bacterium]|nr:hypothetical protein [Bacillota bacterium]
MSIPRLLFKNQLRGYWKLLRKGLPLLAALLVFILFLAGEVRTLVTNKEFLGAFLPPVYAVVLLFIAARRILFLKYPPFYFSLPGLYFFLTTPVNHRLVLAGKILLSYLPLLFLGFGWSLLAGPVQTGLLNGAGLFFCLAAIANISWLLYNTAAGRLFLRKVLAFLAITLLLLLKTPGFVWAIIAAGCFWRAVNTVDEINWSKYENHCRLAYLSRKYFLAGDWGGLESLTYEYAREKRPAAAFLSTRVYVTGYKAFAYGQFLILSRYSLLSFVVFLGQYVFAVFLMGRGEFFSLTGGSFLLLLGFAGLFFLPVQKLEQRMAQGLFPAGGFTEFITGLLLLPAVVAWMFLAAIFFIAPTGINPLLQIAASLVPAAILSYLAVVRGMLQPAFSGWFLTGALLFALLFSCIYRASWWEALLVLLLFIPYMLISWRRMKRIYEGTDF